MFDKFYSHTHLSVIIEVSVVGVPQPLAFLCQGELKVVYYNKLYYCEDPASVSCVLPVPDSFTVYTVNLQGFAVESSEVSTHCMPSLNVRVIAAYKVTIIACKIKANITCLPW